MPTTLTHTLDVHMQNIFLNNEAVQNNCEHFFKKLNFAKKIMRKVKKYIKL